MVIKVPKPKKIGLMSEAGEKNHGDKKVLVGLEQELLEALSGEEEASLLLQDQKVQTQRKLIKKCISQQ